MKELQATYERLQKEKDEAMAEVKKVGSWSNAGCAGTCEKNEGGTLSLSTLPIADYRHLCRHVRLRGELVLTAMTVYVQMKPAVAHKLHPGQTDRRIVMA